MAEDFFAADRATTTTANKILIGLEFYYEMKASPVRE